jgi:hypothetical protein
VNGRVLWTGECRFGVVGTAVVMACQEWDGPFLDRTVIGFFMITL